MGEKVLSTPGPMAVKPTAVLPSASVQPVVDAQSWNPFEVAKVRREEQAVIHQSDRGNLQIHSPKSDPVLPKFQELVSGSFVERQDLPASEESEHSIGVRASQPRICSSIVMAVVAKF